MGKSNDYQEYLLCGDQVNEGAESILSESKETIQAWRLSKSFGKNISDSRGGLVKLF